ncbi:MAG: hypothetical protein HN712_28845 [Gemmatimonadetes bacterium]|nr:hypothetical protein [Gemmatimonadota bacterium]MBT7864353.1 hypothetical protein [Gemmatimonadota bacterium]
MRGRSEEEQLQILRRNLAELHDEWKGPYKDLRDRLRRQVAKLEGHEAVQSRSGQSDPFHVKRQGDARIVLAGLPNAGKSTLVAALTPAAVTVADYPFATTHPIPGMLQCGGGVLQLIDTPPVVSGLAEGQGPGRPLLNLFTGADAILIVIDLSADPVDQLSSVLDELAEACICPIPGPLSTLLEQRGKGGVKFLGRSLNRDQEDAAREILLAAHIEHAQVTVRTEFEAEILQRQADGDLPLPTVVIGTRSSSASEDAEDLSQLWPKSRLLRVESDQSVVAAPICSMLLEALGYTRVELLERPTPDADGRALLVHRASDIAQVADRAGVSPKHLKGARVWGDSVPRPGQSVRLDHLIEADDRVYLQS